MKQVYLKENGKETTSPTAYIRGWVFFIGLLVWLMAVADSFGQTSTRITNVSTPPTGSCNITASVKLEYLKQDPQTAGAKNAKSNSSNAGSWKELGGYKILFSFKNQNGLIGEAKEATTVSDGNTKGVASSSIVVPFGAQMLYVEFKDATNAYASSVLEIPFTVTGAATSIVAHPSDQEVCDGAAAKFSARANGTPAPAVMWQVKTSASGTWSDMAHNPSATMSTLTVPVVTPSMEGYQYRAVFSNACGNPVATGAATLKVRTKPQILAPVIPVQYSDADKCGKIVYFTAQVTSSGAPTVSYSIIEEGVETEITSPHEFPAGTTTVTVKATNDCGTEEKQFTVKVEDKVAPVVTAKESIALSLDADGKAHMSLNDVLLQPGEDNCGIKSEELSQSEFSCAHAGLDNRVKVIATDIHGNITEKEIIVSVSNAAPQILSLMPATAGTVVLGNEATILGKYDDINAKSASITWGDGSVPQEITVTGGNLSASHTYTSAGLYAVNVTVTDVCGLSSTRIYEYIAVYDPAAGFVTGGGWISAPAKDNFGFNAKYQKETGLPSGNVTFGFAAGSQTFKSTGIEWLVISEHNAWIKGSGTINGAGQYTFLLSAMDSDLNGRLNADAFRMQIWNKENDELVYNSQTGAAGNAPAAQIIGGGSIVIHKPKSAARLSAEDRSETEEAFSFGVTAYPNPSSGVFSLTAAEPLAQDAQVKVLDMQGQPLFSTVLKANGSQTLQIDLSGKGTGIYLLQIGSGAKREVIRLVKQ